MTSGYWAMSDSSSDWPTQEEIEAERQKRWVALSVEEKLDFMDQTWRFILAARMSGPAKQKAEND